MSGTQVSAGQKSRTPFSFNFLMGARQLLDEDRADAINGKLLPPGSADFFKDAWEKTNGEDFSKNASGKGVVAADLAMKAYWQKIPNMPRLHEGTEGAVKAHDPNDDYIEQTKGSLAQKMRGTKNIPKPLEDGYDGAIVNGNSVEVASPTAERGGAESSGGGSRRSRASTAGSDGGEAEGESAEHRESSGGGTTAPRQATGGGGGEPARRAKPAGVGSTLAKEGSVKTATDTDPKSGKLSGTGGGTVSDIGSVARSILEGGGGSVRQAAQEFLERVVARAEKEAGK